MDHRLDPPPSIVLASRSPRRLELARARGWNVRVLAPDEEIERAAAGRHPLESLEDYTERLAHAKASAVAPACGSGIVVACDTLGEIDGEALGKPADQAAARRMLEQLAGRVHRVVSGVCVWPRPDGKPWGGHAVSILEMGPLSDDVLERYLASGLWRGKAGACGFQDESLPLRLLAGSASNVVGLPVELLEGLFVEIRRGTAC